MEAKRGATFQPPLGRIDPEECTREFMPLVKRMAHAMKRRLPSVVERDDLVQLGLLGLLQAARRYEGPRERFWHFAQLRIRGAMVDGLRATDSAPRQLRRRARDLLRCVSRLEQVLARTPTAREIAAEMRLTLAQYHHLVQQQDAHRTVELDCAEGEEVPCQECAAQTDPLYSLLERCNRRRLLAALSELPKRERAILILRLSSNLELRRIATLFGVTESRICQLLRQATAQVRCRLSDG